MQKGDTSLKEIIQTARELKGYSQRKLAKITKISNSELSRIESGERQKPDVDSLLRIANALDLSIRDLLKYAGYSEIALQFDHSLRNVKSNIDYEERLKRWEKFYFDILEDSRVKRENVTQQKRKLLNIMDKIEDMKYYGGKEVTIDQIVEVMTEVCDGLLPSQEKYDYSKLPPLDH